MIDGEGSGVRGDETAGERRARQAPTRARGGEETDEADAAIAEANAARVAEALGPGAARRRRVAGSGGGGRRTRGFAAVAGFNASTGRHRIEYEDGDERELARARAAGRWTRSVPQAEGRGAKVGPGRQEDPG